VQGNICRVRNFILDNGGKNLIMVDDDIRRFQRWEKSKAKKLNTASVMEFFEQGFLMAKQLGAKMWGMNLLADKGAYREYTPLSFSLPVLGPFCAHLENPLRYDERLPLKEDYDMALQVLNKFRIMLRFNMYHYICDQHGKPGGCATYRTIQAEKDQLELLQKKWGRSIVRIDSGASAVNRKKGQAYDLNPIIKVPIKGV
jgi:hypothetical protein